MMSRKRVLVSVLSYNVVDDTVDTIRSFEKQIYDSFDLEVVDNASTDDSVAQIRARLPHISVTQNTVNSGYAGGMNTILDRGFAAGYDFVVVCNNDIEVEPDAIARMVAIADAHPDAGVVGVVEVDYFTGAIRAVGGIQFSRWRTRCDWSTEVPGDGSVRQYAFVQGAMTLFTKRALAAGIRMDGRLFMYYEEADVGFQLARNGLRGYVATGVRMRHKAQERYLDLRSGYYMQRNRVFMARKYGRFYHLWWHVAYVAFFELPVKALLRSAQGHAPYAVACAKGFRDGLLGVTGMWNRR